MSITLQTFHGEALKRHLQALAKLRIAVFREYPYLYDGDEAYEARYLTRYAESRTAAVTIAFDNDTAIGACSCLSLAEEGPDIRTPLQAAGYDPARTWYFGESVLLAPYRGQGIGVAFFQAREQSALADPACTKAVFCAIDRGPDHPPGYKPLDEFWRRRGYTPTGLACTLSWKDIGQDEETPHRLLFWSKTLR